MQETVIVQSHFKSGLVTFPQEVLLYYAVRNYVLHKVECK